MHMMERVGHSYQVDGWLLVPEVCSFASLKKILPIIIALFPFYLDFVSWNTLMHSSVYLQRCLREQSTQSRQLISGCYCLLLFVSQNRCHLVNYQDIFFEHKVWSKVWSNKNYKCKYHSGISLLPAFYLEK